MKDITPYAKTLVLIGGGHAHVYLIKTLHMLAATESIQVCCSFFFSPSFVLLFSLSLFLPFLPFVSHLSFFLSFLPSFS
jgi:hypothetical protein